MQNTIVQEFRVLRPQSASKVSRRGLQRALPQSMIFVYNRF